MSALRVALCAATYRRPQGLRRLLKAVAALELRTVPKCRLDVVIVDNSAEGQALSLVEEFAAIFPWPLHYLRPQRRADTGDRAGGRCRCLH